MLIRGKQLFTNLVSENANLRNPGNPENNRFRVPIYFRTNHFTFEKIPPPPLLLHPNRILCLFVCMFVCEIVTPLTPLGSWKRIRMVRSSKVTVKFLERIERHSCKWHMEPIMFVGIVIYSSRVSSKVRGNTVTLILQDFLLLTLPGWDFGDAGTFPQNLFYP